MLSAETHQGRGDAMVLLGVLYSSACRQFQIKQSMRRVDFGVCISEIGPQSIKSYWFVIDTEIDLKTFMFNDQKGDLCMQNEVFYFNVLWII